MPSINGNNKSPLAYQYDGIKTGKELQSSDILTKKLVKINGTMTGVFERVSNKTLWQKIRNQLFSSPVQKKDAIAFLVSKGMDKSDATKKITDNTHPTHGISAKVFGEAVAELDTKNKRSFG